MTQRQALPRLNVGQTMPLSVIGNTEPEGGRLYYVRWGATTARDFGLDAKGRGVRARIKRAAIGEFCGVSPVAGVNIDTDFGNHIVALPSGADIPVMMPQWEVDFDTGIYIPHDITAQIELVGGDPDSTAVAWPAWHSRRLQAQELPPPLRATYANAPDNTEIVLVDAIVAGKIEPAELSGAVSLMCPEDTVHTLELFYNLAGTDKRSMRVTPGVAVSLSGCWKVKLVDGGQWVFGVEL